jgi:hypothetical protein
MCATPLSGWHTPFRGQKSKSEICSEEIEKIEYFADFKTDFDRGHSKSANAQITH